MNTTINRMNRNQRNESYRTAFKSMRLTIWTILTMMMCMLGGEALGQSGTLKIDPKKRRPLATSANQISGNGDISDPISCIEVDYQLLFTEVVHFDFNWSSLLANLESPQYSSSYFVLNATLIVEEINTQIVEYYSASIPIDFQSVDVVPCDCNSSMNWYISEGSYLFEIENSEILSSFSCLDPNVRISTEGYILMGSPNSPLLDIVDFYQHNACFEMSPESCYESLDVLGSSTQLCCSLNSLVNGLQMEKLPISRVEDAGYSWKPSTSQYSIFDVSGGLIKSFSYPSNDSVSKIVFIEKQNLTSGIYLLVGFNEYFKLEPLKFIKE